MFTLLEEIKFSSQFSTVEKFAIHCEAIILLVRVKVTL